MLLDLSQTQCYSELSKNRTVPGKRLDATHGQIWNHSFGTFAKIYVKLTFLTP